MSRVFKEPLIVAGRSRVLLLLDMPVGVALPNRAFFVGYQPFFPRSLLVLMMVAVIMVNGDQ